MNLRFELITAPWAIWETYRLRREVYCDELHAFPGTDAFELDPFDRIASHYAAFDGARMAATVRLVPAIDGILPLQEYVDVDNIPGRSCEVSRFIVRREYRGKLPVVLGLRKLLAIEIGLFGYDHVFVLSNRKISAREFHETGKGNVNGREFTCYRIDTTKRGRGHDTISRQ